MGIFYRIIILAWLLISLTAIQATEFDLGFKFGGDNIGLPHPRGSKDPKGIAAGFFVEHKLSKMHSLQLELSYAYRERQWARLSFWNTGHYFDIAALTKVFPPAQKRIIPYIYIGPVFTTLAKGGTRGPVSDQMDDYYLKSDRIYFSYTIGGGFDFNMAGVSSTFDIRIIREITSSRNVVSFKSNYASVTFGIGFNKPNVP